MSEIVDFFINSNFLGSKSKTPLTNLPKAYNLGPKIWPLNNFFNDELYIIVIRRNLEIPGHSIFFQLLKKFVY